ncbi:MAG: hypothetical protein IPN90_07295 [Elusimicrobia bacterium]|nr:hypothetical protein [Elusimicrobiota bacterium]
MTTLTWDGVGRPTKTLIETRETAKSDPTTYTLNHWFKTESTVTLNKFGQVEESTTVMFDDSGAPDRISTNERKEFVYDSLGRATSYLDTQTSTAAPERLLEIKKSGIIYDEANYNNLS